MNYDRSERIRRAAILIASLDETLAEQMLDALPRLEAVKILAVVDQLGEIDPEEQEDVLEEFRRAGLRERGEESAVEFTYSAPHVAKSLESSGMAATADRAAAADRGAEANDAEAALMAELLLSEHPQTIAAALSRLDHDQASAVFAALPGALQAEVVDRLANLQPADEDSVQDVQIQLEHRIQQHRERRQRAVAGAELARRILVKTAPAQQTALLARLLPAEASAFASPRGVGSIEALQVAQQAQALASAVHLARETGIDSDLDSSGGGFEAWTGGDAAGPGFSSAFHSTEDLTDRSQELESLSDRALLDALRVADERTVQRALAASSEKFLKRVVGKLPRRQANRLRKVVRSLGPTRLGELRAAQHDLLRIARQSEEAGVAAR